MEALGGLAEEQAGYITTAQAEVIGLHRNTLRDQAREGGRVERAGRGLYRLRFFPRSPFEHIAAAWVQAGSDQAVVPTIAHSSSTRLRTSRRGRSTSHFRVPTHTGVRHSAFASTGPATPSSNKRSGECVG